MNNFVYINPTKIIFGKDRVKEIGKEVNDCNIKKVLLLYGKNSIHKNGVYDKVTSALESNGIDYTELSGVKPNPVLTKVEQGIKLCKEHNLEAIVAVGGGSVLDSAKAIAVGALYDGDVWDFFEGKENIEKAIPIFTILTLSATGSEMNGNSVITKADENKKWAISSLVTHPKVSIIDPTVQYTLPRTQTVNGAVDTITHVLEFYFDKTKDIDIMEEYSEGIIRTIINHTKTLLEDPLNYNSRAQFAWASTLALNNSTTTGRSGGDWCSHNIEHGLSALYDIPHGAGLSIIFPAWAKYVYKEDIPTFSRFASKIFNINNGTPEERALKGINTLKSYYKELGSPTTLKEVNIPKTDVTSIAKTAAMTFPMGKIKELNESDIIEILKIAYE